MFKYRNNIDMYKHPTNFMIFLVNFSANNFIFLKSIFSFIIPKNILLRDDGCEYYYPRNLSTCFFWCSGMTFNDPRAKNGIVLQNEIRIFCGGRRNLIKSIPWTRLTKTHLIKVKGILGRHANKEHKNYYTTIYTA